MTAPLNLLRPVPATSQPWSQAGSCCAVQKGKEAQLIWAVAAPSGKDGDLRLRDVSATRQAGDIELVSEGLCPRVRACLVPARPR